MTKFRPLLPIITYIILAAILSACQSEPDVLIEFENEGCSYQGPQGEAGDSLKIQYTNKTETEELAVVILTLLPGYGKAELEAYQGSGPPGFIDTMVEHSNTLPGQKEEVEVPIEAGKEHYLVCVHETKGVISVLAVVENN